MGDESDDENDKEYGRDLGRSREIGNVQYGLFIG